MRPEEHVLVLGYGHQLPVSLQLRVRRADATLHCLHDHGIEVIQPPRLVGIQGPYTQSHIRLTQAIGR
jgi:hypothetical protein